MCLRDWFVSICLFFFLLSFCKAAFVLFSFVTIWLTIVLVTWLLISSILFVIRILFSVILFLFFVVRSRIKVLSSSILLFVVCRSFRRFVFYSAIGIIIFLIKSVMFWFPFDFPMVTAGVVSFLGFLDGLLFLLSLLNVKFFQVISFVVWILLFLSFLLWSYSGKAFNQLYVSCWRGFAYLYYLMAIILLIPLYLVVLLLFLVLWGQYLQPVG